MAKRFHFPLETLLRVRTLREEEVQRRVAAKQSEIVRLDEADVADRAEIDRAQRELAQAQVGVVGPSTLARGRTWVAHLHRQIASRAVTRQERQRELAALQQELREARKQTKILEKLRERRHAAWKTTQARREQAATDEIAQQLQAYFEPI